MIINDFSVARLPRIEFGRGARRKLPELIREFGNRILLVTGRQSFINSDAGRELVIALTTAGIEHQICAIPGEPSPQLVDDLVNTYRATAIDVVVGIGGGSALDAAKAIAGLLQIENSVMDYLEGVGPEKSYQGPALPFIALPTTAGTGSEATKNAVLSVSGEAGFKKSFRHDKLVAEYAVIDPELLKSCPPAVIAANGMDALTQLIESLVSIKSNPWTDALAYSGLHAAREGLLTWYQQGATAKRAQDQMAYAALISGITLAQVGLGSVHGLAAPLGAFFPIPHGIVCGTLVATATAVNIDAMRQREPDNPGLNKYHRIAEIMCRRQFTEASEAFVGLLQILEEWTRLMRLPRLDEFGLTEGDVDKVVLNSRGSSMKTNPILLTDAEIYHVVQSRL